LRWQAEQLVQRALQRWGTTGRTQGCIIVEPRVLYNPELRSTNFIVPGLIAIFLAMLTTLLTALTIIREREQGTLERLIVSPLRPWELMVGKMIPYAFISLVNVFLVIIAGLQVFHVPFRGSLGLLLGLSGIFILGVLGLGLLFSILAPRGEVAVVLVVLTTVLPSLLLSGFVFPLPSMPKVLQGISLAVPARHFLVIVRGIFLKDLHLEVLWPQTLTLLIFAGLMLLLSARRFRKRL
ncbi:MAG TPA: ABC transporter permease, partial [Armatimonadetes bacterium]|nr:ABC transporter permease [Armatimonadota bacterium]